MLTVKKIISKILKRCYNTSKKEGACDMKNEKEALDIAKWFMDNNLDNPRNTFQGNVKLQKLLFFAQLINIAIHDKPLLKGDFYAYENGMVIEEVRLQYKNELTKILKRNPIFSGDEISTLELTKEIYGDANADELSQLSHQFDFWRKYFVGSQNSNGYKIKDKSKVPNVELKKEIQVIKDVLAANTILKNHKKESELDFDY